MSGIVVDASFIGLLNLPNELSSAQAGPLLETLREAQLSVPSHCHLEVANMLVKAERRGIGREVRDEIVEDLRHLVVSVDAETPKRAWDAILPLGDDHGLTVYDAAYLELALRTGAMLASNDKRLVVAARALGVAVLTEPE